MIPKIVHYCWFGGKPLPESAVKCIESWKKFLPDYEIREWNESNFNVNMNRFTMEAYKLKQYAFVSDYARFWILNNYGGVYFDTDVELINTIDDIICHGAFTGMETPYKKTEGLWGINPGIGIGCEKGNPLVKDFLECYSREHFVNTRGSFSTTVVKLVSNRMNALPYTVDSFGIAHFENMNVYPKDFFCPLDYETGELVVTKNTRSIHHYAATWVNKIGVIKRILQRFTWLKVRFIG